MIKQINTSNAPQAVGPYSQAIKIGDLVFLSGQLGIDPKTGNLVEGLDAQIRQTLQNLNEVLKASKSDLKYVLKTTVYLKNMADFQRMNEIYASFFTETRPARATVEVSGLAKNALIEIDAIAICERECCGNCGKDKSNIKTQSIRQAQD